MSVTSELKRLEPSDVSFLASRYKGARLLQDAIKAAHKNNRMEAREKLREADKNIVLVPIGGRPAEVMADALKSM
jgi:hypothetical protein